LKKDFIKGLNNLPVVPTKPVPLNISDATINGNKDGIIVPSQSSTDFAAETRAALENIMRRKINKMIAAGINRAGNLLVNMRINPYPGLCAGLCVINLYPGIGAGILCTGLRPNL